MAILNQTSCQTQRGNTGLGKCNFNPDLIKFILAVPKGTTWDADDLADIQSVIAAGLIADAYSSRFHLFGPFEAIEDQSEDRQVQTLGYGTRITTRDEQYSWMFQVLDGYMCGHKNALKFKYSQGGYDYIFIDNSNNYMCTFTSDATTGATLTKGITFTEFYVPNWKPKDGTNENVFRIGITVANAKQMNENLVNFNTDFYIGDLPRIQDVELQSISALTGTGEVNIAISGGCGGNNLVEDYLTALVTSGNFTVQNAATGGAITVTSWAVAGTSPNRYAALNMDSADTDYPSSGGQVVVDLAAPSVLIAANAAFTFDGQPLVLTVP